MNKKKKKNLFVPNVFGDLTDTPLKIDSTATLTVNTDLKLSMMTHSEMDLFDNIKKLLNNINKTENEVKFTPKQYKVISDKAGIDYRILRSYIEEGKVPREAQLNRLISTLRYVVLGNVMSPNLLAEILTNDDLKTNLIDVDASSIKDLDNDAKNLIDAMNKTENFWREYQEKEKSDKAKGLRIKVDFRKKIEKFYNEMHKKDIRFYYAPIPIFLYKTIPEDVIRAKWPDRKDEPNFYNYKIGLFLFKIHSAPNDPDTIPLQPDWSSIKTIL